MSSKNRYRYDKVEKEEEVKPVEEEVSIDEIADEQAKAEEDDVLVELAVEDPEPIEPAEEYVEEDHHDDFLTGEPLQVSTPKSDLWVKCKPSTDLNLRNGAGKEAPVIEVLHPSDILDVEWTETEWVFAKCEAHGTEGYVMRMFLDRI